MGKSQRRPIPSFGKLLRAENTGPERVPCPVCGTDLEVIGGGHASGLRGDGGMWSGGRDWLDCRACRRWFVRVYSSFRPGEPPHSWEACEPPQFL